jgi:hypothetical protein
MNNNEYVDKDDDKGKATRQGLLSGLLRLNILNTTPPPILNIKR